MRQTAQVKRSKTKTAQLKTAKHKASVYNLNHYALEQQANHAARGFNLDQKSLAKSLSYAEPANIVVPTSRSEHLDNSLCVELQSAFDTDLSSIRIHKDNSAADIASEFHSRAFASGSHIYFNKNEYQPDTKEGRELIAHEVAHVVQQTKISSSLHAYQYSVRDIHGSGIAQTWAISLASTTDNLPSISELLQRHIDNIPQVLLNPLISEPIDEILRRLKSSHDAAARGAQEDQFWNDRARHVEQDTYDTVLRTNPLSLGQYGIPALYDALKRADKYTAAGRLLSEFSDMETYFFSAEAYNSYVERIRVGTLKQNIYDRWFAENSWFGNANPRFIMDRTMMFMLGSMSRNSRQRIDRSTILNLSNANAHLATRRTTDVLIQNEIYWMTVLVAAQIEEYRYELLRGAWNLTINDPANADFSNAQLKLAFLRKLSDEIASKHRELSELNQPLFAAGRSITADDLGSRTRAIETDIMLLQDVLPQISNMMVFAADFWSAGLAFSRELTAGTLENISQVRQNINTVLDNRLPDLRAVLDRFVYGVLHLTDDNGLPELDDFDSNRTRFLGEFERGVNSEDPERRYTGLSSIQRQFADQFFNAYSRNEEGSRNFEFSGEVANQQVSRDDRIIVSWAFIISEELRKAAQNYNIGEDRAMVTLQQRTVTGALATDIRDIFRVRFARVVLQIGQAAGWQHWVDLANQVLSGDEFNEDYIAVRSAWQEDEDAEIARMQRDLRPTIPGLEPLRTVDIVNYLLIEDYHLYRDQINHFLGNETGNYPQEGDSVLQQAYVGSRNAERPHRYVINQFEWIHPVETLPDGSIRNTPRVPIHTLIRDHPLSRHVIQQDRARYIDDAFWAGNITRDVDSSAVGRPDHLVLVLWTFPQPSGLIQRMQQIDAINEVLADRLLTLINQGDPEFLSLVDQELQQRFRQGTAFREESLSSMLFITTETLLPEHLSDMTWQTWWRLVELVFRGTSTPEQRQELSELLDSHVVSSGLRSQLSSDRDTAFEELSLRERKARAHQRRREIESSWRPALNAFERSGPAASELFTIPGDEEPSVQRLLAQEIAERLASHMIRFSDPDERLAHTAMAVIELADTIHEKIGETNNLNIIHDWLPLIDMAVAWTQDANTGGNVTYRETFFVPEEEGNSSIFHGRVLNLETVLENMAETLRENILEWGLVGVRGDDSVENTGHVHALGRESRPFGRGSSFTIDGVTWEILQVREQFRFHPAAFPLRSTLSSGASSASSILFIGDTEYSTRTGRARPHTLLMYVRQNEGVDPIPIYADSDEQLLTDLTWATHMQATVAQLNDLANAIEFVTETVIDLAEFFPVAGQAVAATRLLRAAMLLIDEDVPNMINDLVNNPYQLLETIWDRLEDKLSVTNFLSYLLFSNDNNIGLGVRDRPIRSGARAGRGRSSRRWRRLARKLQRLAMGVTRVFTLVQDRVQDKRQTTEHFVQNSPLVTLIITFIADHYHDILGIADRAGNLQGIPNFAVFDDARQQFTPANMKTKIDDLVAGIGTMDLPADILPLEEIIHALIDIVGHRLGGKYKAGIRILLALLDVIGATDRIVGGIANAIRGALEELGVGNVTDTVLPQWRNEIVPGIGRNLQLVQTDFKDVIENLFSQFDINLNLADPSPNITLSGDQFPEQDPSSLDAQPSFEDVVRSDLSQQRDSTQVDTAQASRLLTELPGLTGEPLPAVTQADAQLRFAQDFSDVRLHRNPRLTQMMESFAARALTSGSHIVISNNLASPAAVNEVLFHELSHVIQQTGTRPLGQSGGRSPRFGRRRSGVRFDPNAEAQADAAAAAAMRGDARSQELSPNELGVQPNMIDLFGIQFLRQLTDISGIEEETAEIDETTSTTGTRLIGQNVRTAVRPVGDRLTAIFASSSTRTGLSIKRSMRDKFRSKFSWLRDQLQNKQADINDAIPDIAIRASYVAQRGRDGRPPTMGLDIDDFTRRLERYILGRTGILIDLTADKRGSGRSEVFRRPSHPYTKAEITFVYLPAIHGSTRIWREVVERRTIAGGATTAIPQADRGRWRRNLRAVLRDLGTSSSVWADGFKLSKNVFDAAQGLHDENERNRENRLATLPANELPNKTQYKRTDATSIQPGGNLGNIRLHLGTYNQKGAQQSGTERESHHITQYLLIEYFHNGHDGARRDYNTSGFPLLAHSNDAYPGLSAETGRPNEFENSPKNIKIEELNQGRGGKMPTILLARSTHRRGNLHINPKADDFDGFNLSTQATALNHVYTQLLPQRIRDLEREIAAGSRPYSEWETYLDGNQSGRPRRDYVKENIRDAMQGTYSYMNDYMTRQLRRGLKSYEKDYFNDLYLDANPTGTETISDSEMNAVANSAISFNRRGRDPVKGMEYYGWLGN